MFNLENLDSVTEKFCNEVVSCTYLDKPYSLNELKNPVTFNGQLFTPHFYILKTVEKLPVILKVKNPQTSHTLKQCNIMKLLKVRYFLTDIKLITITY